MPNLLIDEYDNFANEVLMAGPGQGQDHYESLPYGEGLLKTVFKMVKAAAPARGYGATLWERHGLKDLRALAVVALGVERLVWRAL